MKSILVIDDNQLHRELIVDILRINKVSPRIIEASDGFDGFCKIKNEHFDLVICDNLMPKKNGIDLMYDLIKSNQFLSHKFLMLSGSLTTHEVTILSQLHINSILTKPVNETRLLNQITLHSLKNKEIELSTMSKKRNNIL